MISTQTIRVNNLEVNVKERKGQEPALIFLHGNSMSSKIWQKQLAAPALQSYKIILIDLPRHGDSLPSPDPANDYNVPGYAAILQKILLKLELRQYILIGLSLGGNVALELLPHLPAEACRGVMVTGTAIVDTLPTLGKAFLPNPATGSLFKGACTPAELTALLKTMSGRDNPEALPGFVATDFSKTDPDCRAYLGASIGQGNFGNEITHVTETAIPVAVITGAAEQIINNGYLAALAVPMWRDQVPVIPAAGHLPQWENEAAFNELLLAFVQDYT